MWVTKFLLGLAMHNLNCDNTLCATKVGTAFGNDQVNTVLRAPAIIELHFSQLSD
jgi:hypothetical protein